MGPALARGLVAPSAPPCRRLYTRNHTWTLGPPSLPGRPRLSVAAANAPATTRQARLYTAGAAPSTRPLSEPSLPRPATNAIPSSAPFRMTGLAHDPAVGSTSSFLSSLTSEASMFERLRRSSSPFDTLRHEADVCNRLGSPSSSASTHRRLVDDALHAQNMNIWLEVLRFRLRIDGQDGVMDVIDAMDQRSLKLPVEGPVADSLWSIFLSAAGSNPPSLLRFYTYATQNLPGSDLRRINLYSRILGPVLRENPKFVRLWHGRLQLDRLLPSDAALVLGHFIEIACASPRQSQAIEAFKHVYRRLHHSGLYDECMSRVLPNLDFYVAVELHSFFVREGHGPSPDMSSNPVVAHLTSCAWLAKSNVREARKLDLATRRKYVYIADANKLMTESKYADIVLDAQYRHEYLQQSASEQSRSMPALTRESMNTIVGDVHGIREKELGDAFCARLFATTAFSTDLIISGLRVLGLESVGPLALREIAARVQVPSDYSVTVDALRATGISVSDSVFHRALLSFAVDPEKHDSFNFLVTSDQHPSAYQDRGSQERMYAAFLSAEKTTEANATLDILTLDVPNPDHYHANLLLDIYARRAEREPIIQILQQMRLLRIPFSNSTAKRIHRACLRPRSRSKKPVHGAEDKYEDDLDFTANFYLEIMRSGRHVNPKSWREILKRYGMTNRLDSLEKLCFWLILCYTGRSGHTTRPAPPTPAQSLVGQTLSENSGLRHPYSVIFTDKFLSALISWGFISDDGVESLAAEDKLPSPPQRLDGQVTPERWARGIALVRQLSRLGVGVENKKVRRAVKLRLWMLHGPGKSSRPSNRARQRHNKLRLVHRVMHIDAIWGCNFFALPPRLLKGHSVSDADMYQELFVKQPMKASRKRPASAQIKP